MSQSQTKRTKHSDQATPSVSVPDSATFVANFLSSVTDPIVRESLVTLVRDCIQPLQQEITQLRAIHENHAAEIASLSDQLVTTRDELDSVKSAYQLACDELADLQQYTRRNALRITNPAWPESDQENTDEMVIKFAAEINVRIEPWEISRSHRVGKPQAGKIRPILVKFIGYRTRQRLYKARKELRNHANVALRKAYINEDLTKATGQLAYKAREMKRDGLLAETFTSDCKVFAKKFPGSNLVLIKNEQRLQELGALRSYTRVTNQPVSMGVSRPTQGTGNLPAAEPGGSGPCPQSDSSSQVTSGHAPSGLAAGAESMDVGPQVPENSQNVPTPTPHPGNLNATDDDIVD